MPEVAKKPQTAKQLENRLAQLTAKITSRGEELAALKAQKSECKGLLAEAKAAEKEKVAAKGNGKGKAAPQAKAQNEEE